MGRAHVISACTGENGNTFPFFISSLHAFKSQYNVSGTSTSRWKWKLNVLRVCAFLNNMLPGASNDGYGKWSHNHHGPTDPIQGRSENPNTATTPFSTMRVPQAIQHVLPDKAYVSDLLPSCCQSYPDCTILIWREA